MNLYFLVEGASTEAKFYPELINYFFETRLKQIKNVYDVSPLTNSYYVLSANGYPQIYSHIISNSIKDINDYGCFNYLFVCLDADEMTIQEKEEEFLEVIEKLKISGVTLIESCEIILVVQNRCIESWFLGNKRFYKRNTSNADMLDFHFFYNVKTNDPELMGFDNEFDSHASYHYAYLKHMIRENRRIYSKRNASCVCEVSYIKRIVERYQQDSHIGTFAKLCQQLVVINSKILAAEN